MVIIRLAFVCFSIMLIYGIVGEVVIKLGLNDAWGNFIGFIFALIFVLVFYWFDFKRDKRKKSKKSEKLAGQ